MNRKKCAVSLLELLVVLSILGILSLIALQSVDFYPFQKRKVLSQFKSDVRNMQVASIQNRDHWNLVLMDDRYLVRKRLKKEYAQILPKGWRIYEKNGENKIRFTAKGHPSRGYCIGLSTPKEEIEITILPVTGKINVKE